MQRDNDHDAHLPGRIQQTDPGKTFSDVSEQGPYWRRWVPEGQTRGSRIKAHKVRARQARIDGVKLIDKLWAELRGTPPWETVQ